MAMPVQTQITRHAIAARIAYIEFGSEFASLTAIARGGAVRWQRFHVDSVRSHRSHRRHSVQRQDIALAVASLASGVALAQSNVTIYGIADMGYIYGSGDAGAGKSGSNTFSGVESGMQSGSRLGFKGSEDLGNGLKASFTLEYALYLDQNSGIGNSGGPNARQQFVALSSGKLGSVALGHQYAPGHDASTNNSPFGGSSHLSPQAILSSDAGNTITPASGSHWNNALAYTSPDFSGFTGKAVYGFGESSLGGYNNASTTDNGKFGLGGNYANGPLNVDLVYQTRQRVNVAFPNPAGMGKDIDEGYIGASYDFKVVEVSGSYQAQNDKNITCMDSATWTLGAVVAVMAASRIHFGYGRTDWNQGDNAATGMLNGRSEIYMLGWSTSLSRRSSFYAGYLYVDNGQDSLGVSPSGVGAPGESNQTVLAGIRHTF